MNQKTKNGLHDFNLDYIVGYEHSTFPDYGYSGYQYGPDSAAISLGSTFTSSDNIWSAGGSVLYKLRGLKHLSHSFNDLYDTSIDMGDAVTGDDFSGVTTPSGGWSTAEHMIQAKIHGSYLFRDVNIEVYALTGFNLYFNYGNEPGEISFKPMGSVGFIWTY